jgi:hypothetical protein
MEFLNKKIEYVKFIMMDESTYTVPIDKIEELNINNLSSSYFLTMDKKIVENTYSVEDLYLRTTFHTIANTKRDLFDFNSDETLKEQLMRLQLVMIELIDEDEVNYEIYLPYSGDESANVYQCNTSDEGYYVLKVDKHL